jgi:hypothetical protein
MSERPKNTPSSDRPPTRRVSTGAPSQARTGSRSSSKNVNAPRRTDPFPIVLGAIIGALVIGLLVVVYLISSGGTIGGTSTGTGGTANGGTSAGQPTTAAGVTDVTPAGSNNLTTEGTPATTEEPAPRMTLEDFKKLYDDPAKRPIIIDVRAKEAYDAGHIEGAISFPEADVDTRVGELPKNKLVVAYCQ